MSKLVYVFKTSHQDFDSREIKIVAFTTRGAWKKLFNQLSNEPVSDMHRIQLVGTLDYDEESE